MLSTSAFFQLAPSVVQRIRNNYRTTARASLPTRLTFLTNYGVDSQELDRLRSVINGADEERLAVACILMRIFSGQSFHASMALTAWLRRKGGVRPELKEAATRFAQTLIEADETMNEAANRVVDRNGEDKSEVRTKPSDRLCAPVTFETNNNLSFLICG